MRPRRDRAARLATLALAMIAGRDLPRDASVSVARMADAVEQVQPRDWRLHGIGLTPTARRDD